VRGGRAAGSGERVVPSTSVDGRGPASALYTPFSVGVADWRVMPLAPQAVVSLLQVAIVVAFFGLSLVAGHRLTLRTYPDARSASRAFLPMAAIVLGFTLVGLVVLSLPMGMRHGS
jgi:hypothetical protein